MSTAPSRWMTIGDFLLRRLAEAGVGHLFGVPGDFNLELLQQLEDTGTLKWVGTCNELNASYAADGYARLNGLAAFTVTNAVGALGAINGVAGSYAEHVPVVCIAGSIQARVLYAVQGRVSETLFRDRTTVAAWRSRPTWYAVSRQDRTISPDLQRFLADRMHATIIEIDSGHLSLITRPGEVTRLLMDAIQAVRRSATSWLQPGMKHSHLTDPAGPHTRS